MNNLKILRITTQDEFRKLHELDKEKNGLMKMEPSSFIMRAGGSILHDFYTGIEKIFENIAKEVDRRVPTGEEWHSELIHQMTLEIPGLRPPIIAAATALKRIAGHKGIPLNQLMSMWLHEKLEREKAAAGI